MKKMYRKLVILMGIFSLLTLSNVKAQQEKYYAAFIYQFTKYINWPSTPPVFIISTVGTSLVSPALQEITKEKKVGNSTIMFMEWKTPNDIGACNVLFVPDNQKSNLSSIVSKVGNKAILVVSESAGSVSSGADISFSKKEGKIQFELNKTNLQKKGLNVSSDLERLAAKVY
jgi:hypothetical protein